MSRNYEMTINLGTEADDGWKGILPQRAIEAVTGSAYNDVDSVYDEDAGAIIFCRVTLYGGTSEETYAAEIARCVWKAAGKFVPVSIDETCLPKTHVMDEAEYDAAQEGGG